MTGPSNSLELLALLYKKEENAYMKILDISAFEWIWFFLRKEEKERIAIRTAIKDKKIEHAAWRSHGVADISSLVHMPNPIMCYITSCHHTQKWNLSYYSGN